MTFISGVTEDELQKQVASWLHYALPAGCIFHHSPNEGTRHVAFKRKLKLMGTKFGWPDLEIFVPADESKVGISTSVFIELKRLKGGKLTPNQEEMRNRLLLAGCHWGLARSVEQVRDILEPIVKLRAGI